MEKKSNNWYDYESDTSYQASELLHHLCSMILADLEWGAYGSGPSIDYDQTRELIGAVWLIEPKLTFRRLTELEEEHRSAVERRDQGGTL